MNHVTEIEIGSFILFLGCTGENGGDFLVRVLVLIISRSSFLLTFPKIETDDITSDGVDRPFGNLRIPTDKKSQRI